MSVAEKVKDSVDKVADKVRDTTEEVGANFRKGFQAGTEAMEEVVDKAWKDVIRVQLDNAIEAVEVIGDIVLEVEEQAQEILEEIGETLLEELLEYLSTLKIVVDLKAKGKARVYVETSLFQAEVEFDICKGFEYTFQLLDWTRLRLNYDIDSGLITFKVEVNDKVVTKNWVGLKFGIPATPIPEMFRKQCEKEEDDDDGKKPLKECWMEDGKKVPRGGGGSFGKGKVFYYHLKQINYTSKSIKDVHGTDIYTWYSETNYRVEYQKAFARIKRIFSWEEVTDKVVDRENFPVIHVGTECRSSYNNIICEKVLGQHRHYNNVSTGWVNLKLGTYEDAIEYLNEWRERDAANVEEENKTTVIDTGVGSIKTIVETYNITGYYLIFSSDYNPGGGNPIDPVEVPVCKFNDPPNDKDVPDVPMMEEECCSMLRTVLDRLGGDEFDVKLAESLTDENSPVEKIENIPEMIAKTIEYQDELAGSYPVEVEVRDTDLTKEGNQTESFTFPNQAEILVELYGMLYEVLKNLSVTQELAYKALLTAGLTQKSLARATSKIETIQDFLDYNVIEEQEEIPALFTPGEESWSEILNESELEVHTEEFDSSQRTLSEQLLELMQGAAIIRGRYFQRVTDNTNFLELLKQGKELVSDLSGETGEGKDKEWEEWKEWVENELMKKHGQEGVRSSINDIKLE